MSARPSAASDAGFFPAVEPDAAVFPLLQRLWPAVQAENALHDGAAPTIHTELRAARRPDGEVVMRRFYWSVQSLAPGSPAGFAARTVYCDAKNPAPRVHEFPSDPVLGVLADEDGPLELGDVEMLRYIPLRRVTFRLHDGEDLPARVIAKVKTPGGLGRAATAFLSVQEAALRRGPDGLTVPRVLRHDPRRQVLYLEELPGEPLDVALHRLDLMAALARLGAAHRDLHELDVRGELPHRGVADWLEDARNATTQVTLFVPSVAEQVEAVLTDLVRTAPEDRAPMYCQGDFLPAQLLSHASGWSVVDLDDSRFTDPMSEVAALYVALSREHAVPPDRLAEARWSYLEAYARRAGEPFDRARWAWFLAVVQLADLGKRLFKGRAAPGEAEAVLERLTTPDDADLP